MKKSRIKNLASWALSVAMIVAGAALIASFYFASNLESIASNDAGSGGFNVPSLDTDAEGPATTGPKDKTLKLTVPAMSQLEEDTV
ncbi:MAG: peptidase sortase, partial [Rubrobacteraceae bacterium]|nr:peptidase sortase [Rubrobacteraceae bacterium]